MAHDIHNGDGKMEMKKPAWLKVRACGDRKYLEVQALLERYGLNTVCREANCPNRGECFSRGTATFLILGPNCSRYCRFCNVTHGDVKPVDEEEPLHIASAVEILGLKHAVITSVTRDDLPDGGAAQFARVIAAIRQLKKNIAIEVLVPDFGGDLKSLEIVLKAAPDVFNHNIETVPRLYEAVRPGADYGRSMAVLKYASQAGQIAIKSGIMVGLGETTAELIQVFDDLNRAGVEYLTIGQYLAPSKNHYPIARYYHPDEFRELAELAQRSGIKSVYSAPLVRSSYNAGEQYLKSS